MKKLLLWLLIVILSSFCVFAKDITMAINQTEYFFLVGEQSNIPVDINNSYGKDITGLLSYTVTQEIQQAGFQYTSSNTQSQSFVAKNGEHIVNIGFGTSNQPLTLSIDLEFSYNEDEQRVVALDDITIHFVQDPNQKQNQQNQQQSSSQSKEEQEQNQLQEQVQQMQEQMNQLFQQPQNTEQKLQSNQLNQDSSALKQQMQKQMEEQQKMQEEFKKAIEQNEKFQQQHQQMIEQGFQQTGANLDPINNTSGDFEVNYEKSGEQVTMRGSMENGNLTKLTKTTSMNDKNIMDMLQQNPEFQKYNQQLQNQNFTQQIPEIQRDGNTTQVRVPYMNEDNETAAIKATIENNEITKVELEYKRKSFWWLFLLIPMVILGYLLYKKKFSKQIITEIKHKEKPIDYKKEALNMLNIAKQLFNKKKFKDAYGKASEAIRFYYSHKLNIKTELTNYELIKQLKKSKIRYAKTQTALNLCGLVEFAKYKPNEKDFHQIISIAEKIIQ